MTSGELRVEVSPRWPFEMPRRLGLDRLTKSKGSALSRLLHVEGEPVVVRVAQTARDRVLLGAAAERAEVREEGIARMRFALGLDDDLAAFHERFRWDPLIGAAVRRNPRRRAPRRPEPFEALAWAITEQLIEYERAAAIQRRLVRALGRHCARTGLWDAPDAAAVAGAAPALLESFDLSAGRAVALIAAAREVAARRADLRDFAAPQAGWTRLRSIPGIGAWTVETLAFRGQGHHDQLPAGDLAFVKLVGRLTSDGDPYARATEDEVREFFEPYAPWRGLAGMYALGVTATVKSPGRPETRRFARPRPTATA